MRNIQILVLITFFFWNCNSSTENQKEQTENDSINKNIVKEKNTENTENELEADVEIIDTIKSHQLGLLKIGDPIPKVIVELKNKYLVLYDSIPQTEEDTLYYYYYVISDENNVDLFKIHTAKEGKYKNAIEMIEVLSNRFITNSGIKIGDNVSDIRKKYTTKEAFFTYDDGLWLYVNEFTGAFGLDYNVQGVEDFDIENPIHDAIPDKLKINGIVIH